MKKLSPVPMLLTLIVFSLYHENVDGMDTSTKGNVAQEIQIEEGILEIYNNSKNEINTTVEVNETNESTEKEFFVEIKGDLNTTKETVITLTAVVKNAQKLDACNYWWYDNKKLIDMGATLEKAFEKGEHNITLVVRDANTEETNTSVMLGSYNYKSITSLHFDPYYGDLKYTERVVYNHKGQYVLYDNGTYSKEFLTYNDDGRMVKRAMEYYLNPTENRKTIFTYDDEGNRLVSQTFNSEGISTNYVLRVYDENSSVIDMKFGTDAEDAEKTVVIDYGEIVYDSVIYTEIKVPEDVVELNDNGQVVYEENYYGDTKVVSKMTYDEKNKLVKSHRINDSSYDVSTTIMEYDEKGNPINTEKKYEVKGQSSCHYSSASTFTDAGQVASSVSLLLGGNCTYIDEVKRVYKYDAEGRVSNVKSSTDDEDMTNAHTTLEVIKEYINEIEI
jgi:hypothetical protein